MKQAVIYAVIATTFAVSLSVTSSKSTTIYSCGVPRTSCWKPAIACDSDHVIEIDNGLFIRTNVCQKDLTNHSGRCSGNFSKDCCKSTTNTTRDSFNSSEKTHIARCNDRKECSDLVALHRQGYDSVTLGFRCIPARNPPVPTNTVGIIVVTLVAAFVIISLAVLFFCLWKRFLRKKAPWSRPVGVSYQDPVASYDYISDVHQEDERVRNNEYALASNVLDISTHKATDRFETPEYNHLRQNDVVAVDHYDTTESAAQRLAGQVGMEPTKNNNDDTCYSYNHLKDKKQVWVTDNQYDLVKAHGNNFTSGGNAHEPASVYNTAGVADNQVTLQNMYDVASVNRATGNTGQKHREELTHILASGQRKAYASHGNDDMTSNRRDYMTSAPPASGCPVYHEIEPSMYNLLINEDNPRDKPKSSHGDECLGNGDVPGQSVGCGNDRCRTNTVHTNIKHPSKFPSKIPVLRKNNH